MPPLSLDPRFWSDAQQWARRWRALAWDFVIPPSCVLCGGGVPDHQVMLCVNCRKEVIDGPRAQEQCRRCASPIGPYLNASDGCQRCRDERPAYRRVLALGNYEGLIREAILEGKQARGAAVITALTDAFLERHLAELWTESFDALLPVPHHWQRRFRQLHVAAETIAERLASRLQRRNAPHILQKPLATPRQSHSSATERRRQQRRAFVVPAGIRLDGLRLLLVDDVLTTGATADAAARSLRQAGAADVFVAVIARGIGRHS